MKKIINNLLNFFAPQKCLGCQKIGTYLCESCLRKIMFRDKQSCLYCGKENYTGATCPKCQEYYFLSGVICAGNYNNKLIKKSLINFKYNSLITLNNPLSTYLCRFLDNHLSLLSFKKEKDFLFFFSTCCLCFIPLHNKRKRLRGFNQTELLAKKIAEYFKLPLTDKLEKIHFTKPQAQLNELERRQNLNDSFIFKGQAPKNILLVDDVTTTGTSLQKAAEALRKAGAQKIWGLTIARG